MDVPTAVWALFEGDRWLGDVRELSNAVQGLRVTPDRVLLGDAPAHAGAARAASSAAPPHTGNDTPGGGSGHQRLMKL